MSNSSHFDISLKKLFWNMSEVLKDISKVWNRLFDHKGFLSGEINFTLKEFEEKRGDADVDNLFTTIENITDIKDTQINHLKEIVNEKVFEANQQLSTSLEISSKFTKLEEKYTENSLIEENRIKRKVLLDKFMDDITSEYLTINAEFEIKQAEVKKVYEELERKLK